MATVRRKPAGRGGREVRAGQRALLREVGEGASRLGTQEEKDVLGGREKR